MNQKQQEVRGIQLLTDEQPRRVLHGSLGLLDEVPPQDDCVVVTNQRLMGFSREKDRHRKILLPMQSVEAVEISDPAKSTRPLLQGSLMLVAAVAVIWLAAAFNATGILSWVIALTLGSLAAITASSFFVAEETAVITFRGRTAEVTLPLRSPQALQDAYSLLNEFFREKASQETTPSSTPLMDTPPPLAVPANPGSGEDTSNADTSSLGKESPQGQGWRDV